MALEHLLDTTERSRCVQLVTELVLSTYAAGQLSTVERWLSALGDSAIEAYPPWRCSRAGSRRSAATPMTPSVGQPWSTPRRSTSCRLTARRRSTPRARCCAPRCRGRARADAGRRRPRGRTGAAVESVARHGALPLGRRPAHRRHGPGQSVVAESAADGSEIGHTETIASVSPACARRDGPGPVDRRRRARRPCVAIVEEHRIHDYATSVLPFAAARAWLCTAAT